MTNCLMCKREIKKGEVCYKRYNILSKQYDLKICSDCKSKGKLNIN